MNNENSAGSTPLPQPLSPIEAERVASDLAGKGPMQTMRQEIEANSKRLEECAGPHDFIDTDTLALGTPWRCAKCQGEVGWMEKVWYERGLKHGRTAGAKPLPPPISKNQAEWVAPQAES